VYCQAFTEYNEIKPLFRAILDEVEKKVGSIYKMIDAMEIQNWRSEAALPDTDYYDQFMSQDSSSQGKEFLESQRF
jgi:hypothetical protein